MSGFYQIVYKRLNDLVLSSVAIVIASPLLLLVGVALYLAGGGVFFSQQRPGLHGRVFKIYKFKTMSDSPSDKTKEPDVHRVTRLGKILRSTSLDEIPQLFNILKGDMSFVGPRPLMVKYLPLYNSHQARRHEVRPGITGWAQVNGRNAISWEQKFDLDVWYVDNIGIILDVKILLLTVKKVLFKENVNSSEDQSMTAFLGSEKRD